jgi:hypothetical protein
MCWRSNLFIWSNIWCKMCWSSIINTSYWRRSKNKKKWIVLHSSEAIYSIKCVEAISSIYNVKCVKIYLSGEWVYDVKCIRILSLAYCSSEVIYDVKCVGTVYCTYNVGCVISKTSCKVLLNIGKYKSIDY